MDNIDRIMVIREILTDAFNPTELKVIDESHKHLGHAHGGGGHFKLKIISLAFSGMSLVAMHRSIYEALSDLMEVDIHALSIEASAI
jgi:BolA protein